MRLRGLERAVAQGEIHAQTVSLNERCVSLQSETRDLFIQGVFSEDAFGARTRFGVCDGRAVGFSASGSS